AHDVVDAIGAAAVTISADVASQMSWAVWRDGAWRDGPVTTGTAWSADGLARPFERTAEPGAAARWLRGTFAAPSGAQRLTLKLDAPAVPVRAAYANGQRADFARDVVVFGERPVKGTTFHVALDHALALPGNTVSLRFVVASPGKTEAGTPAVKLAWELWSPDGVVAIGTSDSTGAVSAGFTDETRAFTREGAGMVRFAVPAAVTPGTVGEVTSRWLRVTIREGAYGKDAALDNGKVTLPVWNPPAVSAAGVGWSSAAGLAPSRVVRGTARSLDRLALPAPLYVGAPEMVDTGAAAPDGDPSLHLGFDDRFGAAVAAIYVQVLPPAGPAPSTYDAPLAPRRPPAPQWQYWSGARWTNLTVEDGTRGLQRSGIVRFVPPADAARIRQFGRELYWYRAVAPLPAALPPNTPPFDPMPVLGRIALNTMWAEHAHATPLEVAGGSTGIAGQTFLLSQTPVLDGQRVEVAEPEPVASERARLELAEALVVERTGGVPYAGEPRGEQVPVGYWVTWDEVPDFWASGPADRHYTLDRARGEIAFGDGTRGMIPPRGLRNVRARYRSGGGAAGNVPPRTLVQLKTTVPAVKAVANLEPAAGGGDAEATVATMDRASRAIRHKGRAVTATDFSDLALESSTAIARAVAITPSFWPIDQGEGPVTTPQVLQRAGHVIVVVVPATPVAGASPSLDLLAETEAYLRARAAPAVSIRVIGPCWVPVDVVAHVVPRSLDEAEVALAGAHEAIRRLLDPLVGGDGAGWPFGRRPRDSDVVAAVGAVRAVEHLSYLQVTCAAPFDTGDGEATSLDALSLRPRLLAYASSIAVTLGTR
ncbi:MAG: putative baseplate assembly protein, partial [Deltaproteobacteria bacterium]|nr:putative baseplate assembly protein [Deltaproteobacteria bacterium]